jgi:hypothetical protein
MTSSIHRQASALVSSTDMIGDSFPVMQAQHARLQSPRQVQTGAYNPATHVMTNVTQSGSYASQEEVDSMTP